MSGVLEQISKSLLISPRRIVLIYNNPIYHDIVVKSEIFIKYIEPNIGGIDVKVYTNDRSFKLGA